MWEHPATRENLATLRARGVRVVGPASGSLACGWEGAGRLADPAEIFEAVACALTPQDLDGVRVLVSAGPTREAIDPVRHLSNLSTGKMGYAVARVARRRGAEVTLVSGPTSLAAPPGVRLVAVTSAHEMAQAVTSAFRDADVLVMSAAVADYRPRQRSARKMKKGEGGLSLELERTVDILRSLVGRKGRRTVVGFAAETHDVVGEARRKLREKALDLIVANDVTSPGSGFATETNQVRLLDDAGLDETLPLLQKDEVAARILDWVVARRNGRSTGRVKPRRPAADGVRRRSRAPRAAR
jgi:phosphopantothenoylcysteine decarboxylase/phosphopantothenate--cysteine ligase